MNENVFQEAYTRVRQRRAAAVAEVEAHRDEIYRSIPEIAEIDRSIVRTSMRIYELAQQGRLDQERDRIMRENLDAQHLCGRLLVKNGYPEDYLDLHYTCEKCDDTGYLNNSYCDCLKKEIARIGIQRMQQRAHLELHDFDTFSLSYYRGIVTDDGRDCEKVMRQILDRCTAYARTFSLESPSMLFFGPTGVGKTHLSLAIAKAVLEKGYSVIYDSIIDLLGDVEREHFGRAKDETDTLSLLLTADLLIMDDLGTEFDTSFNVSTVYNIINTRLNRRLPTIISTNFGYEEIRDRYAARIVSRLFAGYECSEFVGNDIRLLKRLEEH